MTFWAISCFSNDARILLQNVQRLCKFHPTISLNFPPNPRFISPLPYGISHLGSFCTNAAGYGWYGRNSYCFGDLISFKLGDNYATVLAADDNYSGMSNYWSYPGQFSGYGLVSSLDFTGKVLLRNHTQLGNPVRFGLTSLNTNNGQQICGRGPTPFPNGADYSLWLLPTYVRQEDGHMRGILPGMLWMPQDRPYSDQTIVDNVVGQEGRRFLLVRTQYSSETEGAQIAFDITGPWR